MLDVIGDPLLQILQYLDIDSLVAATKVSDTWRDAILEHRPFFVRRCENSISNTLICIKSVVRHIVVFMNIIALW